MRVHPFAMAAAVLFALGAPAQSTKAAPVQALSTEDFLNHLGVNTHIMGNIAGWDTNLDEVAQQLTYLGVRLDREAAWSLQDGEKWKRIQKGWPIGKFWTMIDEGGPEVQRKSMTGEEEVCAHYPGLVYALGGPNEEDNSYPQNAGATLADSSVVQTKLYTWAHSDGRNFPVSQMEFGSGWTAANDWEGDYNPKNTGIHQPYTPGPADFAGAHTYLFKLLQRPVDVLDTMRAKARLATPGAQVAQTEFGAQLGAKLPESLFGQYVVEGAFDSAAAGDAAYIVYGLQDSDCFGFYKYPGPIAHAAALDYHTMTTLLASKSGTYGPGEPKTFTPHSLEVSYANADNAHLLLQKPTGEWVVAVWSEQLANGLRPNTDTVSFGHKMASVSIYDIESGEKAIQTLRNVTSCSLSMNPNDTYLVVAH